MNRGAELMGGGYGKKRGRKAASEPEGKKKKTIERERTGQGRKKLICSPSDGVLKCFREKGSMKQ